nr:MAG TPA: hypothetical protein [Caudoviricetes sp.]
MQSRACRTRWVPSPVDVPTSARVVTPVSLPTNYLVTAL